MTTHDRLTEFAIASEPGATSTIAISTALADEDILAATATDQPAAVSSAHELERSSEPASDGSDAAMPILSEGEPMAEPDTSPGAATNAAELATPVIEPAVEAAAAPDVTPPPPSQSAPMTGRFPIQSHKDMIMDMTSNFGSGLNDVMSGAQDKAKEAFEKSSAMMGEVGSFARGNVEAVVESGKILAAGLQDMSTNLVAESRTSFETMTADIKELAASKTPADFFKAQGEIMRKSMDSMVSYGSKNSEAMLKLASDVFAPLSGRMNLAVEKAKMPLA